MEDLSKYHEPIGALLGQSGNKAETEKNWERYRLSDAQIEFFRENGYLAGVRLLNDEQVEILRGELERLMEPSHPGRELFHEYHANESTEANRVLFHALGAWRVLPGFHDLLWNPAFLVPASQLLGGAVRFWHDQLFCKPARHGGVVAWHQDYSYWTRTTPLAHLTCWIGLDDSTRENGCLHYVPGSHKWPDLPKPVLAGELEESRRSLPAALQEQFKPVAIELKKGEASFHHARTMHGSGANDTPQPRRATVINAFRDGVMSNTDEPLLEGVPVIPRGERMGGQFFPLLFEPEGGGRIAAHGERKAPGQSPAPTKAGNTGKRVEGASSAMPLIAQHERSTRARIKNSAGLKPGATKATKAGKRVEGVSSATLRITQHERSTRVTGFQRSAIWKREPRCYLRPYWK